MFYEATIFT